MVALVGFIGIRYWTASGSKTIHEVKIPVAQLGEVDLFSTAAPVKGHLMVFVAPAQSQSERNALGRRWAAKGYVASLIDTGAVAALGKCVDLVTPLAQLQRHIEQRYPTLTGLMPLVMGRGEGAALSFIALAQAPAKTFHSAIGLDFCPTNPLPKTFCAQRAWAGQPGAMAAPSQPLGASFYVFQTPAWEASGACDLAASLRVLEAVPSVKLSKAQGGADDWLEADALLNWLDPRLASQALSSQNENDSPVVEVAAEGSAEADYFVLLLTGDGGWAQLDKELARHISAQGVPVLGFDSLSYFWRKRTPQETAAAISQLITRYEAKWQKKKLVLIGYSFGADVLPFVVANLPQEQQARVQHMVLLGLSRFAHFEFYLTNWLSSQTRQSPFATLDQLKSIPTIPGLCIQGAEDKESICSQLKQPNIKSVTLPGDHHYDEDYETLAHVIRAALNNRRETE